MMILSAKMLLVQLPLRISESNYPKKHHIMIYSEDVHIDIDKKIPITNKNQPPYQILQNFMADNCLSYRRLATDDIYIFKDNSTCQSK